MIFKDNTIVYSDYEAHQRRGRNTRGAIGTARKKISLDPNSDFIFSESEKALVHNCSYLQVSMSYNNPKEVYMIKPSHKNATPHYKRVRGTPSKPQFIRNNSIEKKPPMSHFNVTLQPLNISFSPTRNLKQYFGIFHQPLREKTNLTGSTN